MNQIVKDFGKGFKQLGVETGEKLIQETGKIAESIITAGELLGDIKPMSDEEMANKQAEDEQKRQKEISDVRSQMSGRPIENEIEQISHQKKREEEEKEKMFLENLKRQREIERQNQIINFEPEISKHPKNKGGNPHKKQQPDQGQMSQTSEYKSKLD